MLCLSSQVTSGVGCLASAMETNCNAVEPAEQGAFCAQLAGRDEAHWPPTVVSQPS